VKDFFISDIPPGGREIVSRKEKITNRLVSNGCGVLQRPLLRREDQLLLRIPGW